MYTCILHFPLSLFVITGKDTMTHSLNTSIMRISNTVRHDKIYDDIDTEFDHPDHI